MGLNINKQDFKDWLRVKNLSERTIHHYLSYYNKLPELNNEKAMEFLLRNNNTVARAFLKNLLKYIATNDVDSELKKKAAGIDIPRRSGTASRKLPQVLMFSQVRAVADGMRTKRNRIMAWLTFYGALRLSELLDVKPYDFNWEKWENNREQAGELKVLGKGDKERIVFVPSEFMEDVKVWIKEEVSRNQHKDDPLFSIGPRRWEKILEVISKRVLGFSIHPHTLRHSYGTYLNDQGLGIKEIAEYMGHASVATTQIYIHISPQKLKEKVTKTFKGIEEEL